MFPPSRETLLEQIESAIRIAGSLELPFVVHILVMALLEVSDGDHAAESRGMNYPTRTQ